jgi:hypothetical protein
MGQKKTKDRMILHHAVRRSTSQEIDRLPLRDGFISARYRMHYALQLNTRYLESLHHVLFKLRPEFGPADRGIQVLHIPVAAPNLRTPSRHSRA